MFLAVRGFCGSNTAKECLHSLAVHEFGHAIGLIHEQDRDDTPDWCDQQLRYDQADFDHRSNSQQFYKKLSRSWDSNSVMNYCSEVWSNNGELTDDDKLGVQTLFPSVNSSAPSRVVKNFGYNDGGWRVEKNPRMMADVNGDGKDDIVGFGNAGVYVSFSSGKVIGPKNNWVEKWTSPASD